MPLEFTVLASGSGGNASLIQLDDFSLLLDIGLGPRQLARRLAAVGSSWGQIRAVLITHTHSDHWKDKTLAHLRRLGIPLYCHANHRDALRAYGSKFKSLDAAKLVRCYEARRDFAPTPGLRCQPLPLRHDGGVTFGFRLEISADLFTRAAALGYAADLGSWDLELAQGLADVDLLALEFNHDVDLEQTSGRPPFLIARVLSDQGHLSNAQAVALLRAVARLSKPGRLRQVVQLHLSQECNRPQLAREAARTVLYDSAPFANLYTSSQYQPGPRLAVGVSGDGIAAEEALEDAGFGTGSQPQFIPVAVG